MKWVEKVRVAGLLSVVLILALPISGALTAQAEVQIAEILADPASDWNGDEEVNFKTDEWIEVLNTGPDEVDLSAYWLRDGLGEALHLNLFGTLVAGEVAVFYGSDAVAWQEANDAGSSGFSLNNGGDDVVLLVSSAGPEDLIIIDTYTYQEHETPDDRCSGRLPESGEWALFDGLNPYAGELEPLGTGCEPTPGVANDCDPGMATTATSWSGLKITYQ